MIISTVVERTHTLKTLTSLLFSTLVLVGCSDNNAIPKGDPQEGLQSILFGYRVTGRIKQGPIAIGEANYAYWVRSLVTDYEEASFTDVGLEENAIEHVEACQFDFPVKTQNIKAVFAEQSYTKADLFVLAREDIARSVPHFMKHYQTTGETPKVKGHHFESFKVATVYVAKSVKDTTLVLISDKDNLVWNLQAEEGAGIKNIAILANNTPAIINAPVGANIQALSKKYSPDCYVDPARPPQDYWSTVQNNEARRFRYSRELEEMEVAHSKFDGWFYSNFDQSSEDNMIGSAEGDQFFVGQQPTSAGRLAYIPIQSQPILFGRTDYKVIKGERPYLELKRLWIQTEAELMLGLMPGDMN